MSKMKITDGVNAIVVNTDSDLFVKAIVKTDAGKYNNESVGMLSIQASGNEIRMGCTHYNRMDTLEGARKQSEEVMALIDAFSSDNPPKEFVLRNDNMPDLVPTVEQMNDTGHIAKEFAENYATLLEWELHWHGEKEVNVLPCLDKVKLDAEAEMLTMTVSLQLGKETLGETQEFTLPAHEQMSEEQMQDAVRGVCDEIHFLDTVKKLKETSKEMSKEKKQYKKTDIDLD